MPRSVAPMLATGCRRSVLTQGWIFEPKWDDGYRGVCFLRDGVVRFQLEKRKGSDASVFHALLN